MLKVWNPRTKPNKFKTITGSVEVTTSRSYTYTSAPKRSSTVITTLGGLMYSYGGPAVMNTNQSFLPTGQRFNWS